MILDCPNCGLQRKVPDKYAGKKVKCPQCGHPVIIGKASQAAPKPEAAPPPKPEPAAPPPKPAAKTPAPAASRPAASASVPARYSVDQFIKRTAQTDKGQGLFELESEHLLEINLNGRVWTKAGSMVAYTGEMKFTREGMLEHGVGKFLKKAVSGEGAKLTKAEGAGRLYLADGGKRISVIGLAGESMFINGNDLLAFEDSIQWDIKFMKKVAGMMAGGLFNIHVQGNGMLAVTSHHNPLTLKVSPDRPVITDPNATVAWSGSLSPELKTDISFKTFLGRGSGESFQMLFTGDGFVVIQPYEEVYYQNR